MVTCIACYMLIVMQVTVFVKIHPYLFLYFSRFSQATNNNVSIAKNLRQRYEILFIFSDSHRSNTENVSLQKNLFVRYAILQNIVSFEYIFLYRYVWLLSMPVTRQKPLYFVSFEAKNFYRYVILTSINNHQLTKHNQKSSPQYNKNNAWYLSKTTQKGHCSRSVPNKISYIIIIRQNI